MRYMVDIVPMQEEIAVISTDKWSLSQDFDDLWTAPADLLFRQVVEIRLCRARRFRCRFNLSAKDDSFEVKSSVDEQIIRA